MKIRLPILLTALIVALAWNSHATVRYVDLTSANPTPPFLDWTTAATNIQDAIDASVDGDQILVTNGVYQSGGKVMAGDLTNRVALDKTVTVQSVNGPWATTLLGAGAVNGNAAVRCAWLTNGASLVGFTLQAGATRTSGNYASLCSGGAVWCASSNAFVKNCLILSNTASYQGGGAYQGTIRNSLFLGNLGPLEGAGAFGANLLNCTLVSNANYGAYSSLLTNCIVYYNSGGNDTPLCRMSYCCMTAVAPGTGSFTTPPQLFADGVRLTAGSPCIGTGTNFVSGTDIFGLPMANPPSIGCAEWQPGPVVTQPQVQIAGTPVGFTVGRLAVGGSAPFSYCWLKDGVPVLDDGHFRSTQTTNLVVTGARYSDAGNYQLVVSNAFGVVTSAVARLVVHCVDSGSANPVAPYATWATAASNIQDAIGAALANEVVLVTNGLYATGGKSMDGIITNRVSLDKGLLVQSMNGPSVTTIQGALDPGWTNGPAAVRCAWLTNKAVLSGFTLLGGATRSSGTSQAIYGGGAWGSSVNAILDHCQVLSNYTASVGGGAYQVTLNNCTLMGNHSFNSGFGAGGAAKCNLGNCVVTANVADQGAGGGLWSCNATNCSLTQNSAYANGGGASGGVLINCTITGNSAANGPAGYYGGGVDSATLTNCIIWGNVRKGVAANFYSSTLAYCCTDPLASGPGNIDADPQLLPDGVHVAQSSPCRGVGISSVVMGTDIDSQPWNTPPAMGCDEWQPVPVLAGVAGFQVTAPGCLMFSAPAAGQAPFNWLWSKDGAPIGDDAHYTHSATPNLGITHLGPEDAGVYQAVVSNSFGAVTSQVIRVVIRVVDAAGASPAPPYTNWASAAATLQDAVDVAGAGDIVLVTNGVYANGGKAMAGNLTNRIVLDKALTVMSVNGFSVTIIQGVWDPVSTNGNGAVRCAWLTNGATLVGFTLRNGATRPADGYTLSPTASGGGVWCSSTNAFVSNCILSNNSAGYGGAFCFGTLNNSLVVANYATDYGGAAYWAVLNNCTVINNSGAFYGVGGAGTYSCTVRNSIVLGNFNDPNWVIMDNYEPRYAAVYVYSYTDPLPYGTGNLTTSSTGLQSLDSFHIAATSACRGTGSALYATGTDLDGEPWANPPSIGCDEVVLSNLVGALSVNLSASPTNVLVTHGGALALHPTFFVGTITGRAARVEWNYGDGPTVTNSGATTIKFWANPGDYTVTFTAFNTDNPGGVSTSLVVHVTNPLAPQLQGLTLGSNQLGFRFAGESNASYTVQYATNLTPPVVWQTLQSFYYSSGQVYQVTDPAVTNGTRFYRVLAQ